MPFLLAFPLTQLFPSQHSTSPVPTHKHPTHPQAPHTPTHQTHTRLHKKPSPSKHSNPTQHKQTYAVSGAQTNSDTYIQVYGQGGTGVGWSNFLVWQDIHGDIDTWNKVFVGNLTFENVGEIEKMRFLTWGSDGLRIDTFWADGLNHTKASGFYRIDGSGGTSCDGVEIDFLLDTGTDIGGASCPLSLFPSFPSLVVLVCLRCVGGYILKALGPFSCLWSATKHAPSCALRCAFCPCWVFP